MVVVASPPSSRCQAVPLQTQRRAVGMIYNCSTKEAFEEVKRTEAGDQLCELVEGPYRHEKARYWQANLLFERVSEQAGHPVTRVSGRRS